jgi:hypothetical protein
MPLPARRARTAVACLAVALAPALAACGGGDGASELNVGDVVPARLADQFEGGNHAMVAVPTGTLRIWADQATDTVKRTDTRQLEALEAPDGATLVPITWKFLDDFAAARPFLKSDEAPEIDLVTDGDSYRLPSPDEDQHEGESFYVAVDGDAKQVTLKVTFDGVSQTVDLRTGRRVEGRAAGLYDLDADKQRPQDCGTEDWSHPATALPDYTCDLTTRLLLPYAAGRWAPEGRQYLAVEVRTSLASWAVATTGGGAFYVGSGSRLDARLDGEKPVRALDAVNVKCPAPPALTCDTDRLFVFEVHGTPGPLEVEQSYRLALSRKFGDTRPAQHITGSIEGTVRIDLD